jgi:dolichol-phosphate mannosyltransferase
MCDELTVVVPVYNEEESLPAFFAAIARFMADCPLPCRILYVNDGSQDHSGQLLQAHCAGDSRRTLLTFAGNCGLSSAIKAGFDHCQTSLVGYIDADLQTTPADFLLYLAYFPEYDMVNGIRRQRQDSFSKRIASRLANAYRRMMINDGIEDTCCPLKILKTRFAREIPFFNGMHRFLPALVQLRGGRVRQVPIGHYPRTAGTSKYHIRNRLVGPFFDTLAFRWMRSRTISYTLVDHD